MDLAAASREDIEAYLAGLLARWKPATAANRYRALRVFYAWLEDEGEIPTDPMSRPMVGVERPAVLGVQKARAAQEGEAASVGLPFLDDLPGSGPAESEPCAALEFVHDREGTRERSGRAWRRCAGPG